MATESRPMTTLTTIRVWFLSRSTLTTRPITTLKRTRFLSFKDASDDVEAHDKLDDLDASAKPPVSFKDASDDIEADKNLDATIEPPAARGRVTANTLNETEAQVIAKSGRRVLRRKGVPPAMYAPTM
eukprot:scaffold6807_cov220-Amphora_coffeaeformis.AAC.5